MATSRRFLDPGPLRAPWMTTPAPIKLMSGAERHQRYAHLRVEGMVRDDAMRQMFAEEARAIRGQRPDWSVDEVATFLMSRDFYGRYDHRWAVQIIQEG